MRRSEKSRRVKLVAALIVGLVAFGIAPVAYPQQSQTSKPDKGATNKNADDATASLDFSEAVAQSIVRQVSDGLQGHNAGRMLDAFDRHKMYAYLNFENQIDAFFAHYDSFRIHFRVDEVRTKEGRGIALVDVEMEAIPASDGAQPVHKHEQLCFEMERDAKRWRIVDMQPRGFFLDDLQAPAAALER
jgi:hypothetical protein